MSEEVLGIIDVNRPAFARMINETLLFSQDRTIVARKSGSMGVMFGAIGAIYDVKVTAKKAQEKAKEHRELSIEEVLKADKNNYVIPNSDITEIELKKFGRGTKLNIKTTKKYGKTKWYAGGAWKDFGEKYENILRPIFGDKLSVKK